MDKNREALYEFHVKMLSKFIDTLTSMYGDSEKDKDMMQFAALIESTLEDYKRLHDDNVLHLDTIEKLEKLI